jgi:hypothetical protein
MQIIYQIFFEDENYIAEWNHTRWLVLSSFLFLIPSTYALYNKLYSFSLLLLFTSLISANFWRKATYSWRRNLDLFFSKISFTVFVYNGIFYIKYTPYLIYGYSTLILLLYCYYKSNQLHKIKNIYWYKYHILFHFFLCTNQFLILDDIRR